MIFTGSPTTRSDGGSDGADTNDIPVLKTSFSLHLPKYKGEDRIDPKGSIRVNVPKIRQFPQVDAFTKYAILN